MQTLCRPRARALTSPTNAAPSKHEPKMTPRSPPNICSPVTITRGSATPPRDPSDDDDEDEEDEEDEDADEEPAVVREPDE
jgi:hypothetical protein